MTMNTAIQLQPFLTLVLQVTFVVIAACAVPAANGLYGFVTTKLHLQSNATSRAALDGVIEDAIPYAQKYAVTAVTKVGPIETGNPTIAAAANFILSHAPNELAQLGFTESHVIDLVQSAIQQLGPTGAQATK
jgi:Na+-translocating ferredoxin:NAD+ oxidoreductase RnfG subunit